MIELVSSISGHHLRRHRELFKGAKEPQSASSSSPGRSLSSWSISTTKDLLCCCKWFVKEYEQRKSVGWTPSSSSSSLWAQLLMLLFLMLLLLMILLLLPVMRPQRGRPRPDQACLGCQIRPHRHQQPTRPLSVFFWARILLIQRDHTHTLPHTPHKLWALNLSLSKNVCLIFALQYSLV